MFGSELHDDHTVGAQPAYVVLVRREHDDPAGPPQGDGGEGRVNGALVAVQAPSP
ncbi:hypothetical protein GCM10023083_52100 [Streptomyces phyllanthi]